jgi:hypothetical protein
MSLPWYNVRAFAACADRPDDARARMRELCRGLASRRGPAKPVRALIAGVPNVGKSTLINTLMQRKVAAVSDRPAVAKQQQSVVLKDGTGGVRASAEARARCAAALIWLLIADCRPNAEHTPQPPPAAPAVVSNAPVLSALQRARLDYLLDAARLVARHWPRMQPDPVRGRRAATFHA